jgi:REP element-mobilizing transposase RayT
LPSAPDCVGEAISLPLNDALLSQLGMVIKSTIEDIPNHYDGVELREYAIMPNHIYLILLLTGGKDSAALSTVIGQMKRQASRVSGVSLWQRSFHDHIIRDPKEYLRIAKYIYENPVNWKKDCYFTE